VPFKFNWDHYIVAMLLEDAASAAGGEKPESCTIAVPSW
jgi:hypothetical protein